MILILIFWVFLGILFFFNYKPSDDEKERYNQFIKNEQSKQIQKIPFWSLDNLFYKLTFKKVKPLKKIAPKKQPIKRSKK